MYDFMDDILSFVKKKTIILKKKTDRNIVMDYHLFGSWEKNYG
jgi:hypothetical protein